MLCFVCLQCSQATFSIFGDKGVQNRISEMIEKHLNVKPNPEEQACVICQECSIKLKEFNTFYEYVAEVHRNFVQIEQEDNRQDESQSAIALIKEEWLDDQYPNSAEIKYFPEKDEVEEQNPLLNEEAEDDDKLETDAKIIILPNKSALIEKRTRGRNIKRKKIKASEDIKDNDNKINELSSKNFNVQPMSEDEDTFEPNLHKDEKDLSNSSQLANFSKRPKRRVGHTLLQENENLIKKHIKMACEVCTDTCTDFADLIKHFKLHHPDIKPHIKCCERKLDCPSDILQHAHYHENPEYFKCKECGKSFINKSGLRDHYMQNHEPEENLPFACDHCPRRFSRRNLLEHHHAKHIPKTERSYFCDICQPKRAFANEYILQIHIKTRHQKDSNICHVCAKEIRDKQAFEKHVRLHFEESGPRLKCPRDGCDSWLKDKDNLKQHLRRFHDPQQYGCPQCGRICKNKHSLTCHLKTTHTTKMYSCEECKKNFKSQQSLREHMAGHTGEALYNCPFCSRTFNSKANMYSHKKKAHPKEWKESHQAKKGSVKL